MYFKLFVFTSDHVITLVRPPTHILPYKVAESNQFGLDLFIGENNLIFLVQDIILELDRSISQLTER